MSISCAVYYTSIIVFSYCCSLTDTVTISINLTADPGQTEATLDWTIPDLAAHLAMYDLTADFNQGSMFRIGVKHELTRVATGPQGKNFTFVYIVTVTGVCPRVCASLSHVRSPSL